MYIYIDKLPSIGFQSPILTCCFRIDHWTVVIRSRGIHRRKTRVCMERISRGTWRIWMLQSRTHSKALQLIELGSSLIDSSWHTHIIYIYNYIWLYIYIHNIIYYLGYSQVHSLIQAHWPLKCRKALFVESLNSAALCFRCSIWTHLNWDSMSKILPKAADLPAPSPASRIDQEMSDGVRLSYLNDKLEARP